MPQIELSREEQRRILGEIDLALEARTQQGTPEDEPAALTLLWGIIKELRDFCRFLGAASGVQQIMLMEKEAQRRRITTPGVLIFLIYRVLQADTAHREIIAPKWLKGALKEIDEDSATDPEPSE